MDGKQRCTSIVAFMDGDIPFISPSTRERFYYRLGSHKGKQLPDVLKRRFDLMDMQGVEYDNLEDEQQRDIFRE